MKQLYSLLNIDMAKKKQLPQNIIDDLNSNLIFNKFGLVNIARVKATNNCDIPDDELKEMIQEKFGHEMVNGKVEFIEKKK